MQSTRHEVLSMSVQYTVVLLYRVCLECLTVYCGRDLRSFCEIWKLPSNALPRDASLFKTTCTNIVYVVFIACWSLRRQDYTRNIYMSYQVLFIGQPQRRPRHYIVGTRDSLAFKVVFFSWCCYFCLILCRSFGPMHALIRGNKVGVPLSWLTSVLALLIYRALIPEPTALPLVACNLLRGCVESW